jgi:prepilin-type N-terminal cleavage/methylation domain-containing protein
MRSDPEPTDVGFTLLELMVVLAILVLIAGFAVPALTTLSGSSGLTSGGRIVANLLTVARSEAINRRTSIRFEVATNWPPDSTQAYRKIALVQSPNTQITGWQTLPTGIAINSSSSVGKYFFSIAQAQNPKLTLGGQQITTSYLEFTPNGAPNVDPASAPVTFLVVPAYIGNKSPTQIVGVAGVDYYAVDVDALVGKTQVRRP